MNFRLEQIKRIRSDMKSRQLEFRSKQLKYEEIYNEYSKLPNSINRQVYIRRIMDIMKNLDAQKNEISKILTDVRSLQKNINQLSQTSKRSFDLAEEIVFSCAKTSSTDLIPTRVYKCVVRMREEFVLLVDRVELCGRLNNEVRELTRQYEELEQRNTNFNMERVQTDLEQVKKENKSLNSKIKK
jgi:hypothetical protein